MPGPGPGPGPVASGVRLDVSDLEVRLGRAGADVVGDVSFAVRAGQVLGLVGESGSGKTTVVLALLGHSRRGLRISAGQVHVDGVDLLRLPPPSSGRSGARGSPTCPRIRPPPSTPRCVSGRS